LPEYAVELKNVCKVFHSGSGGEETVQAVKDINLTISPGEFFTLLGPSGCGKTTTLRLVAGFEVPSSGEVFIQNKAMSKIPPNLRPVNTVFQNYALFPHLNVEKNVVFGLAVKRVPKDKRLQRAKEALELVQLAEMGQRKPSQLSGGQQQRVALARALVNQPAVLLLDEPLGALDLKLRKAMQLELKQIQKRVGITFIYVTHDQEEALTMSDRIAVMNHGDILQVGDPVTLYERPASRFVADFIGESNFFSGTVKAIEEQVAQLEVGSEIINVSCGINKTKVGERVTFTVRPEKMMMATSSMEGKGTSGLEAVVEEIVYIGTDTRYILRMYDKSTSVMRLQNTCIDDLQRYQKGDQVRVYWKTEDARIILDY
jgi:spermidine/putrescine transport system ATP-binding protein